MRTEFCRSVYSPGSIGSLIREGDSSQFRRMASMSGFDKDQIVNQTVFEYCSVLWLRPKILHFAAFHGCTDIFDYLIANQASLDNSGGYSLSQMAVAGGNFDIITKCNELGCSFDGCMEAAVKSWRLEVFEWFYANNGIDLNESNMIHVAAQNNNIEMILYYLENGCDVNRVSEHKETPLHGWNR